jgi:16S rRNA (guanine1516-N2)-methyltransferase
MSVDSPASVALLLDQAVTAPDAATIAALKLPETTVDSAQDFDFLLQHSASGWQLQQTGKPAPGPVRVDFSSGASSYRRNKGGGELIVKAVSGKKQQLPTVLDATAGLGGDAFVLASRGYPVTLLERSPLIALLLADGLRRAANSDDMALREIVGRLHLQQQDSLEYLRELPEARLPDVIYIDPMFPASKKSAQVKKEMQAFQRLLGKDQDSAALLELALAKARHRVVVKRPLKSGCLAAIEPTFCLQGKAVRFDIYALRSFDK